MADAAICPDRGNVLVPSHLRQVRLRLAPGVVEERDVGEDEREVAFDGLDVMTDTVRIEAMRVWPGARWADLCIGEVMIEGGAPEG